MFLVTKSVSKSIHPRPQLRGEIHTSRYKPSSYYRLSSINCTLGAQRQDKFSARWYSFFTELRDINFQSTLMNLSKAFSPFLFGCGLHHENLETIKCASLEVILIMKLFHRSVELFSWDINLFARLRFYLDWAVLTLFCHLKLVLNSYQKKLIDKYLPKSPTIQDFRTLECSLWSKWWDSNSQQHAPKACRLPIGVHLVIEKTKD